MMRFTGVFDMVFKRLMILASMMAAVACGDDSGGDSDEGSGEGTTQGDASTPTADAAACANLTYDTFGKQFIDSYCVRCHAGSLSGAARNGAPKDDVFDTLKQVQQHKGEIQTQVRNRTMPFPVPPGPQPTDEERAKLDAWISCGPN